MSHSQRTFISKQHHHSEALAELVCNIPPMTPDLKQKFTRKKNIFLEIRRTRYPADREHRPGWTRGSGFPGSTVPARTGRWSAAAWTVVPAIAVWAGLDSSKAAMKSMYHQVGGTAQGHLKNRA
jgi:hypothetical protein